LPLAGNSRRRIDKDLVALEGDNIQPFVLVPEKNFSRQIKADYLMV